MAPANTSSSVTRLFLRAASAAVTLVLLLDGSASSQSGWQAAVDTLIQTELAFARMAAETNTRDAFSAYIAEKGILFRPGPVPGRDALARQQPQSGILAWRPIYSDLAASSDLGFNTGPWSFRPSRDAEPTAFGHFVTIWKRQPDGTFRFALDIGITSAADTTYPQPVERARQPDPPSAVRRRAAAEDLVGADAALNRAVTQRGYAGAVLDVLADGGRVLRNGAKPAIGSAAVRTLLREGIMRWQPVAGDVSRAGDFGYTYGSYDLRNEGVTPESGSYLHIWRRDAGGEWKLVLDLLSPHPRPSSGS